VTAGLGADGNANAGKRGEPVGNFGS